MNQHRNMVDSVTTINHYNQILNRLNKLMMTNGKS